MNRYFVNRVGAAFLLFASAGLQAQGIVLSFDPAAQSVDLGSSVNVGLVISGLGDSTAPSLGAFDLDIHFDPGRLSFSSATFGDPVLGDRLDVLGLGGNSTVAGITSPGVLNVFEVSLDSPADLVSLQEDRFTLATLTFSAIGAGNSALGISINSLSDENAVELTAEVSTGSVTVAQTAVAIPEIDAMTAAGALTLLAGALCLKAERRRR